MCDASEFAAATVDGGFYYSPTFKDDKFIHATADPQYLLEAGNHFYKVTLAKTKYLFLSKITQPCCDNAINPLYTIPLVTTANAH